MRRPTLDAFRGRVGGARTRVAGAVAASTALLTAAFVGVVAVAGGHAEGAGSRVPFYVLAMAVVFVVVLYLLDSRGRGGTAILLGGVGIALVGLVLVGFAGEGAVYALREPAAVFGRQLIVYFVAAALICTGFGYWLLGHWREFLTAD